VVLPYQGEGVELAAAVAVALGVAVVGPVLIMRVTGAPGFAGVPAVGSFGWRFRDLRG